MMALRRRNKRLDPAYLLVHSTALNLRKKEEDLAAWEQQLAALWLNDERRDDMAPDLRVLLLSELRWDLGETIGWIEGCAKKLDRALEEMA